jgi:hypothetical protein
MNGHACRCMTICRWSWLVCMSGQTVTQMMFCTVPKCDQGLASGRYCRLCGWWDIHVVDCACGRTSNKPVG